MVLPTRRGPTKSCSLAGRRFRQTAAQGAEDGSVSLIIIEQCRNHYLGALEVNCGRCTQAARRRRWRGRPVPVERGATGVFANSGAAERLSFPTNVSHAPSRR